MEELTDDPIITFYMRMSNSTVNAKGLPVFSETTLRLSFMNLFGALQLPKAHELQLYRKLLLFSYLEKYTSISDLSNIMICFDVATIREHCNNFLEIFKQWHTFLKNYVIPVLYQNVLNDILFEFMKRYTSISGSVNRCTLRKKAFEIQRFIGYEKLPKLWYKCFSDMVDGKSEDSKNGCYSKLTKEHLKVDKIYNDVKKSLNMLAVRDIESKFQRRNDLKIFNKNIILNILKLNESTAIKAFSINENKTAFNVDNFGETDDKESITWLKNVMNLAKFEINGEESEEILGV